MARRSRWWRHVVAVVGVCGGLVMASAAIGWASPKVGAEWVTQVSAEPDPNTSDLLGSPESLPEQVPESLDLSSDLLLEDLTTSQALPLEFHPLELSELLESALGVPEWLLLDSSVDQNQLLIAQTQSLQQLTVSVSLGLGLVVLLLTALVLKR